MAKSALITGITGQDGAYLAEYLLEKGYVVHGIKRRASQFNTQRIDHIYQDRHDASAKMFLHYADLSDSTSLVRTIQETQPDEIYNLAAMSHVHISFEQPEYTADIDAVGTVRLLEAVRLLGMEKKVKFYQASTSELYGSAPPPQSETTAFQPRSPYAVAKLYSYWIVRNYRDAYDMFACNGILFNHESPTRGENFVTRKITQAVARIGLGLQENVYLGNLNALRDWGHAKDYVEAMHLMLQQDKPEDYVIATGVAKTVREFASLAFAEIGVELEFFGDGLNEKARIVGIDNDKFFAAVGRTPDHLKTGDVVLEVLEEYFRPSEVESLLGDPSKAQKELGWKPKYTLADLTAEMVRADIELFQRDSTLREHGFETVPSIAM